MLHTLQYAGQKPSKSKWPVDRPFLCHSGKPSFNTRSSSWGKMTLAEKLNLHELSLNDKDIKEKPFATTVTLNFSSRMSFCLKDMNLIE